MSGDTHAPHTSSAVEVLSAIDIGKTWQQSAEFSIRTKLSAVVFDDDKLAKLREEARAKGMVRKIADGIICKEHQFQGGQCWLYINESTGHSLTETLEFELDNLEVVGREEGATTVVLQAGPGEEELLVIRLTDPNEGYSLSVANRSVVSSVM